MKIKIISSRWVQAISLALALVSLPVLGMAAEDYVMDNGLKVILLENHRAPVVSLGVWVNVGSTSENPKEYGLAHLLEHMMFKGTTRRGVGQISKEVEAAGGIINASTSYDHTFYHIDIASRFVTRGLDVLADMVFNSIFDPGEFEKEKEVVIEEIKMGLDDPERLASKALFAQAFQVHPHGRPIIGFVESVRAISRTTAVNFYRRWYKPGNMILVVAGDFEPAQVKPLIQEAFGQARTGQVPKRTQPEEPVQTGIRAEVLRMDVTTARLLYGFHIPAYKSKDIHSLDVLGDVLGQGRTSRLYRVIKRDKELANRISAMAYTPKDPGLFFIGAELAPEKAIPATQAIMSEVAGLGADLVSQEELIRARLQAQADMAKMTSAMSGEAHLAASYEAYDGDYRAKDSYLAELEKVSVEDLRRVTEKYLRLDNLSLVLLLPTKSKLEISAADLIKAAKQGIEQVVPGSTHRPTATLQEYTLKNGARLIVKAHPLMPLVAVRAGFMGGLRYEDPAQNGLGNLLAEVWDRGTTSRGADDLARAVEDIAGRIKSYSGRDTFGLDAEFISTYLDQGLALFTEVLTQPSFNPKEVDKARPNVLASIERERDKLPARTFQLYARTLYGPHPYGRPVMGRAETVKSLTAQDLRAFYEKWARPDGLVLTVVGNVNPEHVRDRLDNLLAGWSGRPSLPPIVQQPPQWTGLKTEQEFIEKAQAHLVLGFLAPGVDNPDRYPLEVLDAVLAGMGGRMFIELRDKQSLGYSLSSFYRAGLDVGSFGLYIGFDPGKIDPVRAGFRKIIQEISQAPVTEKELAGAKEFILGRYEISLQQPSAQAANLTLEALLGLGLNFREKYVAGINAVTAADVLRAAQKYLNLNQAVEVTVGAVKKE